ncbi:hypothetical protein B0H14DRAFT_3428647 [Mycena olivaceomarginata]|nr:hypothetical protein B0H14DRAFT_3428647 [Mycena olivaceomarginata]
MLSTNVAMAVTALLLGLKPSPEISFHDGLVVFYLLFLSWVAVFFSLRTRTEFPNKNVQMLHIVSIIQSYVIFAFALTLLITAKSFGRSLECNANAVVVVFRPFSALKSGRTLYTGILVKEQIKHVAKAVSPIRFRTKVPDPEKDLSKGGVDPVSNAYRWGRDESLHLGSRSRPRYRRNIAWSMIVELVFISILWSLSVMNTELLIRWNHFAPSDDPQSTWQFGQVLPMFLVVPPLINMVNAFREHQFRMLPLK